MKRQTTTAYSRRDLRKWKVDLQMRQPLPTDRPKGFVSGVNIVSFSCNTSGNGAYVLLENSRGDPPMILLLNPVVAVALREAIAKCGLEGGWIDRDGKIVEPAD